MDIWDQGETVMGVRISDGLYGIQRSRGHGITVFGYVTTVTVDSMKVNQRVMRVLKRPYPSLWALY